VISCEVYSERRNEGEEGGELGWTTRAPGGWRSVTGKAGCEKG
jgi:hypothetical protein